MSEKELQTLTDSITKGLAYAENGGKLDLSKTKAGKTGEVKSIFQFTPDTWKLYSKQTFGKEVPITNDSETYVVRNKVKNWIQKGYTTSQIASMWNAGESKPDAYKQNWRGVNKKYGVEYNTPDYASKVLDYSKKFYQDKIKPKNNSQVSDNKLEPIVSMIQKSSKPQENSNNLLNNIVSSIKSTTNKTA